MKRAFIEINPRFFYQLFCPKFHCELNAIEGVWCNQKEYVRKRTDQTYPTMIKLIKESRIHFIEINLHKKLIKRFWSCLKAYNNGATYAEVLKTYFSGKSKGNHQEHLRISNNIL